MALKHEGLPAGVMLMKVLMGMFAVLVRAESGMGMAIKLSLVLERPVQFHRHLLDGAVMMFVRGVQGLLRQVVMHVQSHTQASIELRAMSQLEEPNFWGFLSDQLFCLHERVIGQIVDLVEDHY